MFYFLRFRKEPFTDEKTDYLFIETIFLPSGHCHDVSHFQLLQPHRHRVRKFKPSSYQIVSAADRILDKNLSEESKNTYADKIELPVRKLAHMTEYCILTICISFPLYVYGVRGFWLFLLAGLLSAGFACTDEFHQSVVSGRGPSKRDVLIDSTGALFGMIRPDFLS